MAETDGDVGSLKTFSIFLVIFFRDLLVTLSINGPPNFEEICPHFLLLWDLFSGLCGFEKPLHYSCNVPPVMWNYEV